MSPRRRHRMFVEAEARQKLRPFVHMHQDARPYPAVGEVRIADVLKRQAAYRILVAQVGQHFGQVSLDVRMGRAGCGKAAVSERVLDGRVRIRPRQPRLKHPDHPGVQLHSSRLGAAGGLFVDGQDLRLGVERGL